VGLAEARRRVASLRPWRLAGRSLYRSVETGDFAGALRLLNKIARVAEEMEHHPDVEIGYGYLRIRLTTHDAGGPHGPRLQASREDRGDLSEG
jgi:4a-hydroxytetrahydrobiopterin dehydratase